ncbi:MAG: hypothetical protein N3G20_10165, partial [Verrucomicrobiae bacterium]|nr:hypothetical protein [Verrucomicrobiae bacterium]
EQMGGIGLSSGIRQGQSGAGFRQSHSVAEGPIHRTVYVLDKGPDGKPVGEPRPVTILTGISDGSYTEVIEGLNEGDIVVLGLNTPTTAATSGVRPGGIFGPPVPPMRPPR